VESKDAKQMLADTARKAALDSPFLIPHSSFGSEC
jgi:hypothetical protein